MEYDFGTPFYKAVVIERPQQEAYGLVTARVRYKRNRCITAKFLQGNPQAMNLKCGDEVWVCPFDGEAGPIIQHNLFMRLWALIWH